jgi:hypothetical protein
MNPPHPTNLTNRNLVPTLQVAKIRGDPSNPRPVGHVPTGLALNVTHP